MLLSIDPAKVAELLNQESEATYRVSTSELPPPILEPNNLVVAESTISGTIYVDPFRITAHTKELLMMARRAIESSGVALKDPETLTREIDEMRGRR